jgi:hypothetical protein
MINHKNIDLNLVCILCFNKLLTSFTKLDMYFCIRMRVYSNFSQSIALIILVSITVLLGCNNSQVCNSTYFGGKIINPKSNCIILFENEIPLDTFYLDKNNTFLGEIPSLHEGLFNFKHGNEQQYIYLQPKDSLLIRLNTWDFDETLVFSGKGAERNNLLIDSFLESERERRIFFQYYDLSPTEFSAKVSQVEKVKLDRYNDYINNHPEESDKFNDILKTALTFPLYSKVENYPLAHSAKINHDEHSVINKDFYKHREYISLDNDSLMFFYAYRDYVLSNLYNKVNSLGYDLNSDEFTVNLLKEISAELNDENSRNSMLRKIFIRHFYWKSSRKINENIVNTYFDLTTNLEDKKLMLNLTTDVKKIEEGELLNDFKIIDYNKSHKSIRRLIKNKKSVLYFWNPEFIGKDFIASKIQYLSEKYPDLEFIGVRIYDDNKERIFKLDIKSQYYLESNSKANSFLTSQLPRTILINKKGIVVNSYASLSSRKIFNQIEELARK